MKTLMLIILAIAGATCISTFFAQSHLSNARQNSLPGFGGIAGYVFDPEGKPVENAEVYVKILDGAPFVGSRPESTTDKEGRFFIRNVRSGLNRVHALKVKDGYPDVSDAMYKDTQRQAPPEIFIKEGQITNGVVVHLGRKCEKLFGSVVDADTRKPIGYASITFYRVGDPNIYNSFGSSTEGKFEILLPPVPIKIKASAQDYEETRDFSIQELLESARSQAAPKNPQEVIIFLHHVK